MFIVSIVHADGPSLGKQWIRDTFDECVELVASLLKERNIRGIDSTVEAISSEQGYVSDDGSFAILIGAAE